MSSKSPEVYRHLAHNKRYNCWCLFSPPRSVTLLHRAPFLHSLRWYTQFSFSAHTVRDDIRHWDAPPRLLLCRLYNKPHPEGPCSALHRLRRSPEGRVLPPGDGHCERASGLFQSEYPDIFVKCKWQSYSTHLHKSNTQKNTMKQNTQNGTYIKGRIHKHNNKITQFTKLNRSIQNTQTYIYI